MKFYNYSHRKIWQKIRHKRSMVIQSDLYYPRFLKPKLSTPNFYQLQSDLYYSPSVIREPRLSTVFEDIIQYAQVPRIIEVWLYY